MPRTCTVCAHPERSEIDRALVSGTAHRSIAKRYALSDSAMFRHQAEHVPQTLAKAREAEETKHAIDVLEQLRMINRVTAGVLVDARQAKDHDATLKAVDRIQRQIELQAKLLGELSDAPTININVNPQWIEVRAVLLDALAPYPEARIAAAGCLVALGHEVGS